MKSIVLNQTNISVYLVSDETEIIFENGMTTVGNPAEFHISDCNESNCTVVENLTDPEDWVAHKYLVVNGAWVANPTWVDPTPTRVDPTPTVQETTV